MKSFKELFEGMAQEMIHRNSSVSKIKALANHSGHARFVIDKNGDFHAADAFNFTHNDIMPGMSTSVRGTVQKTPEGFHYEAHGPYDNHHVYHPKLLRLEKAGIVPITGVPIASRQGDKETRRQEVKTPPPTAKY